MDSASAPLAAPAPVRLRQGIVWSQLETTDGRAIRLVQEALTVASPSARFVHAYKSGYWDGTIKFFQRPHNRFLTGLTWRVIGVLAKAGIRGTLQPLPFAPRAAWGDRLEDITLREYQLQAIDLALTKYRGRACLQVPTGGGKTEIGLEIIRRLGRRTLWLTHKLDLITQTEERARARLPKIPIGLVKQGRMSGSDRGLIIASVQTLMRASPTFLSAFDALILDECHHGSSQTWAQLAEWADHAAVRIGLSGTVSTGDPVRDLKLEGLTGPMVPVISTTGLVELGFLAKPRIHLYRAPAETYPLGKEFRQLNWQGSARFAATYEEGIVRNGPRNAILSQLASQHVKAGEKVLILCQRLEHGQVLRDGLACPWLSGKETMHTRAQTLRRFRQAKGGQVLVASTIFNEGVDIPELDVLLIAGGGESSIQTLQRIGRALRPRPDKTEVLIYDFLDGRNPAQLQKTDYLALHAIQRLRDYLAQGFTVTTDDPAVQECIEEFRP